MTYWSRVVTAVSAVVTVLTWGSADLTIRQFSLRRTTTDASRALCAVI